MANHAIKIDYTPQQETLLATKAADCIPGGIALCDWLRGHVYGAPGFPVPGWPAAKLSNKVTGYFDEYVFRGKPQTIMVCRQDIEMSPLNRPDSADVLRDYVNTVMMNTAHWTYPDGNPGGFGEDWYFSHKDGVTSRVAEDLRVGQFDWRSVGRDFDWVMLNVRVYDFAIPLGPIAKRVDSAVCVVPHPHFTYTKENPSPGIKLEMQVGYSYADYAPFPNFLGYGPGKLGDAVKLYQFILHDDGKLECRLVFASSPRCRKVLDFASWIPDPIYDTADLIQKVSFGIISSKPVHNMLDTQMIELHGVVHQKYMDGVDGKLRAYAASRPMAATAGAAV